MSDGGAQRKVFGPFFDSSGVIYTGIVVLVDGAGTTTEKTYWTDETKATAVTDGLLTDADGDGIVTAYFDGNYRFRVGKTGSVHATIIPLDDAIDWDNYKITSDTGTMWEGNFGTSTPAPNPNSDNENRWQMFVEHDASNNFEALHINEGSAYTQILRAGAGDPHWKDIRQFGTFDAGASAATNTTTFNAALASIFSTGHDLMIPVGIFALNPVSYEDQVDDFESGIKIFGAGSSMVYDNDVSLTLLDFSAMTNTSDAMTFSNTGTSGWVNLTLENLSLYGPSKTAGDSIGILFKGVAATNPHGVEQRLVNVGINRFYEGFKMVGTNNWSFSFRDSVAQNCTIGWNLANKSTIGTWDNVTASTCVTGFRIGQGATNQTFITPHASSNTNGFVFDTENAVNITDIVMVNPYFEGNSESCIKFGFEIDGTANTANTIRRVIMIGGLWSHSGTAADIQVTPERFEQPMVLGSAITDFTTMKIVKATKANPVVITTADPHGLTNAFEVFISGVEGQTELNNTVYTVANKTANTFELSGIDGTAHTAYTIGGQVLYNLDWTGPFHTGLKGPSQSTGKVYFGDNTSQVGWLQGADGGVLRGGGFSLINNGEVKTETKRVEITTAQMLALNNSPKELVAAQGINTLIEFESIILFYTYNSVVYAEPSTPDDMQVLYDNGNGTALTAAIVAAGFVTAATDEVRRVGTNLAITADLTGDINKNIVLQNTGGNYTNGDSDVVAFVTYKVHKGVLL